MKELGESNEVARSYDNIVRIQKLDKPYILKFLQGPETVNSVFYPYVDAQNKIKTAMYTTESKAQNPLGVFASIDKEIQKEEIVKRLGETSDEAKKAIANIRSAFDPNITNHYLGLDKDDPVPIVRRIEVKWTVTTEVRRLTKMEYTSPMGKVDKAKLHYGPTFLLWFDVRKILKDVSRSETMTNTAYSVRVVEDFCNFKGMFNTEVNSFKVFPQETKIVFQGLANTIELPVEKLVEMGAFTEDEYAAMINYEFGIKELTRPMTHDEIMEKLQQNPIVLNAMDKNNKLKYPSWEQIAEKATKMKLELPFTTSAALPAHEEHSEETEQNISQPVQTADDKALEALLTDKSDKPKEWNPSV